MLSYSHEQRFWITCPLIIDLMVFDITWHDSKFVALSFCVGIMSAWNLEIWHCCNWTLGPTWSEKFITKARKLRLVQWRFSLLNLLPSHSHKLIFWGPARYWFSACMRLLEGPYFLPVISFNFFNLVLLYIISSNSRFPLQWTVCYNCRYYSCHMYNYST